MRHPRDFSDAVEMVKKVRAEQAAVDATLITAAILVLADSIMSAVGTHGDDILKAARDIGDSIDRS